MHTVEQELDALFAGFTEHEKFYRDYYEASRSEETLRTFLEHIKPDSVEAQCFYIPELNHYKKEHFAETHLFTSIKNNVVVERHQRYTPPFKHTHSFFEIVYVWRGTCDNTVEDTSIKMKTGDMCILAPEVSHTMGVFDDSIVINILTKKTTFNETFFSLLSDNNLLSDFFSKILYTNNADHYVIFHTEGNLILRHFIAYLIKEALFTEKDVYSDMLLENMLSSVFGFLLRGSMQNAELSKEKHTKDKHVLEILQYTQDNYKTATLEEVAAHFGYTSPYLSKLIKASTGTSFSSFISDIRHKKACSLLSRTDTPIHEICELTGYGSIEHFHRVFKKKAGCTPTTYRKRTRK